ncbi:MAG: carboxypeptidase regulatory-like domain-containing protein [Acidobacteria bacterium]|nr:carboxypeptidase regulatory-like domain-containing protein [Acidobacteriota bacterium]
MLKYLLASVLTITVGATSRAAPQSLVSELDGVVEDAQSGLPIANVTVTLVDRSATPLAVATSNTQGRFRFSAVADGQVYLVAHKYPLLIVPAVHGLPAGAAMALVFPRAETSIVTVQMRRGGVIEGTVWSPTQQPVPGATVRLERSVLLDGTRDGSTGAAAPAVVVAGTTGRYRFAGLPDGEYFVLVSPPGSSGSTPITIPDEAEIEWAERLLARDPQRSASPSRIPQPVRRQVEYAPVYHPGTVLPADAAAIHVTGGNQTSGVDIRLTLVSTVSIAGVVSPAGLSTRVGQVSLLQGSNPQSARLRSVPLLEDGRFGFSGLSPGAYRLIAHAKGEGPAHNLSAELPIVVGSSDIDDLVLHLEPGRLVSGQVTIRSAVGLSPSPAPTSMELLLRREDVGIRVSTNDAHRATVAPDNTFSFRAVPPGRYSLHLGASTLPTARLWSVDISGAATRREIVVQSGQDLGDLRVDLVPPSLGVAGSLIAEGQALQFSYAVVVFPVDPADWKSASASIAWAPVRPDRRFTISELPAGDYLIAAVFLTDTELAISRPLLEDLASVGVRLALQSGTRHELNLKVGREPRR